MLKKAFHHKKNKLLTLGPKYAAKPIKFLLIINVLILLIVGSVFPFIQPVVPLFYSLSEPQHHLADKSWLFLLPALSLIINFIHIKSVSLVDKNNHFVVRLFIYSGLVLQVILLMITVRNIIVVFKPF